MAGRGTDIRLSETVFKSGGLHVIVSEAHAAARIDRQDRPHPGRVLPVRLVSLSVHRMKY